MPRPKGYKVTEETRVKLSKAQKGRKLSAEHIEKIRQHQLGRVRTQQERESLSKGHMGLILSEEEKVKIRINQPHRKTIYCQESELYFSSIRQVAFWVQGNVGCRANIGRAVKLSVPYKKLHFELVTDRVIPVEEYWMAADHKDWRGYITESETNKKFSKN